MLAVLVCCLLKAVTYKVVLCSKWLDLCETILKLSTKSLQWLSYLPARKCIKLYQNIQFTTIIFRIFSKLSNAKSIKKMFWFYAVCFLSVSMKYKWRIGNLIIQVFNCSYVYRILNDTIKAL